MQSALLFSSVIGIFLSFILLFFNEGYRTANKYLGGFFFFISLFILSQYSGLYGNSAVFAALFASGPTPFVFLIGPFAFFYIRSVMRDDTRLTKFDYLHFLLFLLQFAGMLPYYFSSWVYKLSVARVILSNEWHVTSLSLNAIFVSPINSFLRPLHLLVYLIAGWSLLYGYYKKNPRTTIPLLQAQIVKRWLIAFISVFTLFLIIYCLLSINLLSYATRQEFQSHSPILMFIGSLSFVALNLITLLFPQILYGLPRMIQEPLPISAPAQDFSTDQEKTVAAIHTPETPMLQTSPANIPNADVHPELYQSIEQKLRELYSRSEPWTDKNFSIATLAITLDIPEHHLRYYFNHELKLSFPEYRNRLRVEHVKRLLQSEKVEQLSMEGIGALAGFPSKSTFFSVFKNETGMTPGEFVERGKS